MRSAYVILLVALGWAGASTPVAAEDAKDKPDAKSDAKPEEKPAKPAADGGKKK